jgi:hypothetical protein
MGSSGSLRYRRRFPRVNYQLFGGTNPAAVLYAKQDFIAMNPNTVQAKTLKWIATATTDEIVNTVPRREICIKALRANLLVCSKTGLVTRQGMNSTPFSVSELAAAAAGPVASPSGEGGCPAPSLPRRRPPSHVSRRKGQTPFKAA